MLDAKEQEFLKRLRATFRIEADEHLRALSAGLIELERTTEPARQTEIVEAIFREAHSLKGAARSVNLKDIESICQPLESALAALKRQEIPLSPALFDMLLQAVDSLSQLVSNSEAERTSADRAHLRELSHQLIKTTQGEVPPGDPVQAQPIPETPLAEAGPEDRDAKNAVPAPSLPVEERYPVSRQPRSETARIPLKTNPGLRLGEEAALAETVKISITKLDPLLVQAEEMIQAKLAAAQRAADLREIQQFLISLKQNRKN